jgi:sugar phosphate permease
MRTTWQLTLLWGVLVGSATGVTAMVLAAIIATRWFDARRGLVMGMLSAANATGQLVFLPWLARLVEAHGWRAAALGVAGSAAVVFVLVFLFMRDRPEDIGLAPYGRAPATQEPRNPGTHEPRGRHSRPRTHRRAPVRGRFARVLDPRGHVLHLRREHERAHRHASDPGVPRLRHF